MYILMCHLIKYVFAGTFTIQIFGALFLRGISSVDFNSECKHLGVWAAREDRAPAGSRYAELVHK